LKRFASSKNIGTYFAISISRRLVPDEIPKKYNFEAPKCTCTVDPKSYHSKSQLKSHATLLQMLGELLFSVIAKHTK